MVIVMCLGFVTLVIDMKADMGSLGVILAIISIIWFISFIVNLWKDKH